MSTSWFGGESCCMADIIFLDSIFKISVTVGDTNPNHVTSVRHQISQYDN